MQKLFHETENWKVLVSRVWMLSGVKRRCSAFMKLTLGEMTFMCSSSVQSIMLLSTLYYFFASSLHFLNKNILLRYPLSECSSNFQPWESNKVPQKNKVLFLNYFFDSWNRKSWNRNSWNRTRDGDCDVANRVWQQYPVDNGMFWCSHSNDPSETGQQKRGGPSGFQATSKWKSLHGHDPCT